eukprot:14658115-Alexandrium_andersonii.AAC.1
MCIRDSPVTAVLLIVLAVAIARWSGLPRAPAEARKGLRGALVVLDEAARAQRANRTAGFDFE